MAGTTFGRYKLIRLLARGGMAEVYLALLSGVAGFEKRIALKKILPIYTDLEEFNRLFQDEARIGVTLNHSNIVQVFDFGVHQSEYYLAMEYVDGPDLEKILMGARKLGRQLSIDAVVHIAMRIASALEYAHSRVDQQGRSLDLVHRDVSPPNVLLSVQGEVKLTDFGVARYAQRISQSRPGVVRGKYAYMSPEQLTGDILDSRSDLFSMGVLLFEMLTNVNPFLGESDYKTMEKVVACRPGSVTDYRSGVPRDLVRIVERCLRLHPGTRYQTAGQIRRDLAELMFSRGVIDDPQLIVDELWSLFPSQLSRRGLSVPRPREDDPGAISVGMPRMRAGKGVTTGEDDWVGGPKPGTAQLGPEYDDEDDPEDDLTIPHIVGNLDAIPTLPLDGHSHTMDAPPLSPANKATLEQEENPFAVKGLTARSSRAAVEVEPPLIPRGQPGIQAALASPVEIDEEMEIVPSLGGTDEVAAVDEPADEPVAVAGDAPSDIETYGGPAVVLREAPAAAESKDPPKPKRRKTKPGAKRPATKPGAKRPRTKPGAKKPGAASKPVRTTTPKGSAANKGAAAVAAKTMGKDEEDEFPLYGYILVAFLLLALFWFAVNWWFGPGPDDGASDSGDPPAAMDSVSGASAGATYAAPDGADPPGRSPDITPMEATAPEDGDAPQGDEDPEDGEDDSVEPEGDGEAGSADGRIPEPLTAEEPSTESDAPAVAASDAAASDAMPATPEPTPQPTEATPAKPAPPEPTPRPTEATPSPLPTPTPTPTPPPEPPPELDDSSMPKMTITTKPPGAALTIDGKRVGSSPYALQAPSGTIVEIVARKDGYLSTTRLARLKDLDSTTVVELSPSPTPAGQEKVKVTITAEPWAYVAVDGVVTGKSTPLTLELDPGSHTITIENPLESWTEERSVVVKAGEASTITFSKP